MTTNLNPARQSFLVNINRVQQQLNQASAEVSSGKRVNQASDAPDQIESLLQLRANQQHNQQIESNLTLAQTNAQTADTTLSASIQLMDQAVQVGSEGANSSSNGLDMTTLSQQVGLDSGRNGLLQPDGRERPVYFQRRPEPEPGVSA